MSRLDRWLAQPEIWRVVVVAAVAVHTAFVLAPFDVLHPIDPWELGRSIWRGHVPYRDFASEYPPGAFLAFLLPGAVPRGLAPSMLALQAVACELGILALLGHDPAARRRWVLIATLAFPLLSGGFDAMPTLALLWATALLGRGNGRGWWMAGIGAAVKVFPGIAWGWCRQRLVVGLPVLALTVAVLLSPLLVAASDRTPFDYHLSRGVEQGTLGASLTFIADSVRGRETEVAYRFRANEVVDGGAAALAVAILFGAVAVTVAVVCLARGDRTDPWRASLALLLLSLCASKVLSPQFIVLAAPLLAALGAGWFAVGIPLVLLTVGAFSLGDKGDLFMTVVSVRNALLAAMAIAAAISVVRHPRVAS